MDSPCRERFLEITKETSHSFSNIEGTRRYSCNNKNTYLTNGSHACVNMPHACAKQLYNLITSNIYVYVFN